MNNIKVKVEIEKKLVIPKLGKLDEEMDRRCILDNRFSFVCCEGIVCEDCICNIDNMMALANSQNLQLL